MRLDGEAENNDVTNRPIPGHMFNITANFQKAEHTRKTTRPMLYLTMVPQDLSELQYIYILNGHGQD